MKTVLTPRQFADAIGVSESSVKRWVDGGLIVATRTAGGHRRIATLEAARYIREHGIAIARPELLGLGELAASESPEGEDAAGQRLFEYLKAGAVVEAQGCILSSYLGGESIAEIIDGPVAAAMARLGEAWVASPSGILWEHRATQIAIQAVNRLRQLLAPRPGAPRAVGGAPSGDSYQLASLAVAAVLEGEGLEATNLGPQTPLATLALSVEELGADLVWLSVSVLEDRDRLRSEIEELVKGLATRGAILVVGGSQAPRLGLSRSDALYVGRSMAELEALVRGMRLAPRPA